MKNTNFSTNNFNHHNSLLTFVFEYEFKKIHRQKLESNFLTKPLLTKYSNFSNLKKYTNNLFFSKKTNFTLCFKNYKHLNLIKPYNINLNKNLLKQAIFIKNYTFN
jgi:hypothetical protein